MTHVKNAIAFMVVLGVAFLLLATSVHIVVAEVAQCLR